MHPETRNTIYVEQAKIITQHTYAEQQFLITMQAPKTAVHAKPGSFVHIQCGSDIMMRRPMSIMRTNQDDGTIDILYKVHGHGTELLTSRSPGDVIDLLGPIGKPFKLEAYRKTPLLIGGGVGMPPMIFLAEHISKTSKETHPFVILGSEIPFPFKPRPSKMLVQGVPGDVIGSMPLLDDWGIACRLASKKDFQGCYNGYVTDLARLWLQALDDDRLQEVEVFTCGPLPMLEAVSQLAFEFDLPCQVSLEEYMACAVGGCAGCTVRVETEQGPAMQRVCVDGPVFDAYYVF